MKEFLWKNRTNLLGGIFFICLGLLTRIMTKEMGFYNIEFITLISIASAIFMQGKLRWIVPVLTVAVADVFLPSTKFITLFTWSAWGLIGMVSQVILRKPDLSLKRGDLGLIAAAIAVLLVGVLGTGMVFDQSGQIAGHPALVFLFLAAVVALILVASMKNQILMRVIALGLGSTLFFYLYTNFGVWLEGWGYPRTLAGLIDCYVKGLPFLERQIRGNLLIVPIGFLASNWARLAFGSLASQVMKKSVSPVK